MKRVLLTFFLLLYLALLHAQAPPVPDSIPLERFMERFDSLLQLNEDQGRNYANEVMPVYERFWAERVISNYRALLPLAEDELGQDHRLIGRIYYRMGRYAYIKGDYEASVRFLKKGIQQWGKTLPAIHVNLASSHYLAGMAQSRRENYPEAVSHFRKAYKGYSKNGADNADYWAVECYRLMGQSYKNMGQYQNAVTSFDFGLNLYREKQLDNKRQLADFYADQAVAYSFIDNQKAISLNQKAVSVYASTGRYADRVANCRLNNGAYFSEQGEHSEALRQYREALAYYRGIEDAQMISDIYENMGTAHIELGVLDSARTYFFRSLALLDTSTLSLDLNSLYHNIADFFLRSRQLDSAAHYVEEALRQIIYNYDDEWLESTPDMGQLTLRGPRHLLLEDLELKGRILHQEYAYGGRLAPLQKSLQTYSRAADLIDRMRRDFTGTETQLFWLEEGYDLFEKAITTAYLLFSQTQNPRYAGQAFRFMERNKAVLILQNLNRNMAAQNTGIPDSLLYRRKQLIDQQLSLERTFIELQEAGAPADRLKENREARVALKEKRTAFEEQLLRKYPQLAGISPADHLPDLQQLQSRMRKDHLIIEYFLGDTSLFALSIGRDRIRFRRLARNEVYPLFAGFLAAVTPPRNEKKDSPEEVFRRYVQSGHSLYDLLLGPFVSDGAVKKITLVPDGFLNYLPFDLLLTAEVPETTPVFYGLQQMPYLLKNRTLHYAYSVSLLQAQRERPASKAPRPFIGFAPLFQGKSTLLAERSCEAGELGRLQYNEAEIESILEVIGGDLYAGRAASKEQFSTCASEGRILHFSTHACVDPNAPAQSRIFFSDDFLLLNELQTLDLQSDLVVLSACETGVGAYYRGEGTMSLARSFVYSGSPSVVMSLWSVNDESTAKLMAYFYEGLKKGRSKSEALRGAKLRYLQEAGRSKLHPFYWGAFIQVGSDEALFRHSDFSSIFILCALGVLVLTGLAYIIRKRYTV